VWMQIATPKEAVDPTFAGGVHTAKVVYAAWWESDPNGDTALVFDRSIDGGWSWGANRQVIFTNNLLNGEWTRQQHFQLLAWENNVYVVLLSSRLHPAGHQDAEAVIALASTDQGQTWHGPTLLSKGVNGLANGARIGRLDFLFMGNANLREAQVVQRRLGEITIRIVRGAGYSDRDESRIQSLAERRLGTGISIQFEYVEGIERGPSGKMRHILSHLPEARL